MTGDAALTVEPERGRLFGLAYRLLGSASDAEDILQDAFLRWGGTGVGHPVGRLSPAGRRSGTVRS